MDIWNLIVVLSFMVLYLGIAMIFVQMRRLREELQGVAELSVRERLTPAKAPDITDQLERLLEPIIEEVRGSEASLNRDLATLSGRMDEALEAFRQEVRYSRAPAQESHHSGDGRSSRSSNGDSSKGDAYREAKLLLTNGVDEERVINETGLTVEEVSLLKRLSNPERGGALVAEAH